MDCYLQMDCAETSCGPFLAARPFWGKKMGQWLSACPIVPVFLADLSEALTLFYRNDLGQSNPAVIPAIDQIRRFDLGER